MNQAKTAVILALFLAVSISAGCGSAANSNAVNAAANESAKNGETANTNLEELRPLIALPFADKLVEEAKKIKPPTPAKIGSELWFPAELIAQADNSGDDTLNGTTYAANAFFQPPFTDGKLTRIQGTDYFVLELTAQQ